ncbi:MAG: transglycosylase SLT domain-containing protein [Betaproteobacteria bacterium]|nr:transglycosylase SLT domain-containing protein [Betaproteobacteria bacterium]
MNLVSSLTALLFASAALSPCAAAVDSPGVPRAAEPFRRVLTREAYRVWGLQAPVSVFAAQAQQESGWNPQAVSRAGAVGLAQFMPATARWWCEAAGIPEAECLPQNPVWAMRALVGYDHWLWERTAGAADDCERMAFTLRAYNGGEARLLRERFACASDPGCDPSRNFGHTEKHNAGRSAANWRENTEYPGRILHQYAPGYAVAGWGSGVCP